MSQASYDYAYSRSKVRYNKLRKSENQAVEAEVASYYLKEKYSGAQYASNREELQTALDCLDYNVTEYAEEGSGEVWQVVEKHTFAPQKADIGILFERAVSNHYKAVEDDENDIKIYANCLTLFEKDYKCQILENPGGALSWNYPVRMIIPMSHNEDFGQENRSTVFEFDQEFEEFSTMSKHAAIARCRNRFPVPVILCEDKYICRSGTLAVRKGMAFGTMTQPVVPEGREVYENPLFNLWGEIKNIARKGKRTVVKLRAALKMLLSTSMDDIKDLDVKILKALEITYICDLMVENRKIHTGLRVGSSEKINMRKYGTFRSLRIPYPGCEFFARYHHAGRRADGLVYNWDAPEVNSSLGMSEEEILPFDVEWEKYIDWDIVELTKNYMRLLLNFAAERGSGGLLVHCISGWDRTPLFISLLRISLWADGLIHKSLNVVEMSYLTLGYDWYLFGHDLPTRLRRKEEIMHFCFNFLPELVCEEYSTRKHSFGGFERLMYFKDRQQKILNLSKLVLQFYEEKVKMNEASL